MSWRHRAGGFSQKRAGCDGWEFTKRAWPPLSHRDRQGHARSERRRTQPLSRSLEAHAVQVITFPNSPKFTCSVTPGSKQGTSFSAPAGGDSKKTDAGGTQRITTTDCTRIALKRRHFLPAADKHFPAAYRLSAHPTSPHSNKHFNRDHINTWVADVPWLTTSPNSWCLERVTALTWVATATNFTPVEPEQTDIAAAR